MSYSTLIFFICFLLFSFVIDISGFLRSKTDTERGKAENIDCQKMREFRRVYNRCKRKWLKDTSLHGKYESLDLYVKSEYAKLYDWERLFYEHEYK